MSNVPTNPDRDDVGLLSPLLADGGRHLLTVGSLGLLFSGYFAVFLAATGQFLPHDVQYLGITPQQLCGVNGCAIVHFMQHDRVAFGGVLIAIAVLFLWLIAFPLRDRQPWAWWTLAVSNAAGFASFGLYLGYGYLDTWHALATLVLLPCFAIGLAMTWRTLPAGSRSAGTFLSSGGPPSVGRSVLLAAAAAQLVGGLTITAIGTTVVFVPQDLAYMRTTLAVLAAINPRLVPLIAHDRAGFGAGVTNAAFLLLAISRYGRPTRSRWQAMAIAIAVGYGLSIGVHPAVGYNSATHLAPAVAGAVAFAVGLWMVRP